MIALLHDDIENLPMKNFDADPSLKVKLDAFREKVKTGRMIRYWSNRDKLIAAMMQAIVKAINTYPAAGWIRGDAAASDEVMRQFIELNATHNELQQKYQSVVAENSAKLQGLASLAQIFIIRYRYTSNSNGRSAELTLSWGEILKIIGPNLYAPSAVSAIKQNVVRYIFDNNRNAINITVVEMDLDQIKIHFVALGILKIEAAANQGGGISEFISLTEKGQSELINLMAVREGGAIPDAARRV